MTKKYFLECCSRIQEVKAYKISPQYFRFKGEMIVFDRILYLPECSNPKPKPHSTLIVEMIGIDDEVIHWFKAKKELKELYISKLMPQYEIKEPAKKIENIQYFPEFYLEYNEYGQIEKCYQNLSALKKMPEFEDFEAQELNFKRKIAEYIA